MVLDSTSCRSRSTGAKPAATSKWCARALRPLTSAVLRLEKHLKNVPMQPHDTPRRTSSNFSRQPKLRKNNDGIGRSSTLSDSESTATDPTWVPGCSTRQRIKHRYSVRKDSSDGTSRRRPRSILRSPAAEKLEPGEFTIATPLILGKRRIIHEPEQPKNNVLFKINNAAASVFSDSKNRIELSTTISKANADCYGDFSFMTIFIAILNGMSTFLRATSAAQSSVSPHRVPSLLSMALNKTSEYIVQEQGRLDNAEDNDDDIDVADIIITDLENTYAVSNEGWEPLRKLVRTHGIRLLSNTIRNGWIRWPLAGQMVLKALEYNADDAAEAILEALLPVTPNLPPPQCLDDILLSSRPSVSSLWSLGCYIERKNNPSFLYREVSKLLLHEIIPVSWMATDSMKPYIVDAIASTISLDEHSGASAELLGAVLRTSMKPDLDTKTLKVKRGQDSSTDPNSSRRKRLRPQENTYEYSFSGVEIIDALNNSISSIIISLCSAHVSRHEKSVARSAMSQIVTHAAAVAQQHIGRTPEEEGHASPEGRWLRIGYIVLARYWLDYYTTIGSQEVNNLCSHFLREADNYIRLSSNRNDLFKGLSSFFLRLARCLGRDSCEERFRVITSLAELFEPAELGKYPAFRAALAKVAVDAALSFAEDTCLREHSLWATELQDKVAAFKFDSLDNNSEPLTPSLCLSSAGFRWEDGIGEWVAWTPCAKRKRPNATGPSAVTEQNGTRFPATGRDSDVDSERESDLFSNNGTIDSSVSSDHTSPCTSSKRSFASFEADFEDDRCTNANHSNDTTHNLARWASIVSVEVPAPVIAKSKRDFDVVVYNYIDKKQTMRSHLNKYARGDDEDDVIASSAPTVCEVWDEVRFLPKPESGVQVPKRRSRRSGTNGSRRRASCRIAAQDRHVIPCSTGSAVVSDDDELSFL